MSRGGSSCRDCRRTRADLSARPRVALVVLVLFLIWGGGKLSGLPILTFLTLLLLIGGLIVVGTSDKKLARNLALGLSFSPRWRWEFVEIL